MPVPHNKLFKINTNQPIKPPKKLSAKLENILVDDAKVTKGKFKISEPKSMICSVGEGGKPSSNLAMTLPKETPSTIMLSTK